ncbi:hypothetical protein [Pseudomonas ovata]|uniref:hypothetical protein n=1 Tax=Pseudomonas ovata TaxID=1839709 RepID=UPI000D690181|nr:hypothetical protein [Pseudomonas ovata]
MALDIMIRKTDGTTSRAEFPEGLHQALFRNDVRIRKTSILYHLKDYYLTDCSFRNDEILRLVTALESEKTRLPAEHAQALENVLALLGDVDLAEISFAGD